MTYKIKSLIYFLGLLVAIMLYYATDSQTGSLEQKTQVELADNFNNAVQSDLNHH